MLRNMNPEYLRREFLKKSLYGFGGAVGAAGSIQQMRTLQAAAGMNSALSGSGDYKAMVCIFLFGGNDSSNTLIPTGEHDYALYQEGRQHLAIPKEDILPISPATDNGRSYGLHPALPEVKDLFDAGNLAFINNVGSLYAPTSRQDFLSNAQHLPIYLFSHIDQSKQWMTSLARSRETQGWAGRVGDLMQSVNENTQISMNISLGGANYFQTGAEIIPFAIGTGGTVDIRFDTSRPDFGPHYEKMAEHFRADYGNLFSQEFAKVRNTSFNNHHEISSKLIESGELATVFPEKNYLADQLKMVARMIKLREELNVRRQIYFCWLGGFDTHMPQLEAHHDLLTTLSQAMGSFYQATEELGVANDVVTFTASDFGRTFTSNGAGSDHGWGADHMVMGGGVQGGDLYGTYPILDLGGPNDSIRGSWIPTTAVDEFGATLAKWMGVTDTDMPTVFPNLHRFNTPDLGFMA